MDIFIEVSKGSNLKYEHDKENDCLILDRILHNTNSFPYNYGYIPNTLSPDEDPLDVIVLCNYSLHPGCMVKCKILGGINTHDEKGQDDKIIAIPVDKIDPMSKGIDDISDIHEIEMNHIKYFLEHYKDNEEDKFINVDEVYNRETALEIIKKFTL